MTLPKFKPEAQTLRMQGQYADTDSGLYYNTSLASAHSQALRTCIVTVEFHTKR
ncbi:MAG: hypothetical protein IIZ92_03110 [Aquincola sp.]|nr:hypothetical protein [Aquincola sp.]